MTDQKIYTVGGAVQAGSGIYIKRKADDELLQHCRAGEFAFILSSRQVGKSSLMFRTAQKLEQDGIRSVVVDLSAIGVNISAEEWYLGILDEIKNNLNLKTDIFTWWSERSGLGPAQRMINFLRDVLLKEVNRPVVLFLDEIDSTLSIPFADDFFAAVRAIYNARSTVPDFKRLSFVMIGVATPSDLVADSKRTPFNIGFRVELTDFTFEEALPLAGRLGKEVLGWILQWTGGHPYLTQMLCEYLSKREIEVGEKSVEDAVRNLFEGEQGRYDNNLQFVRDMLTRRAPDIQRVLKTYKDIRSGKKVTDDERSIPKAHLKISGVVRRENGLLLPRNRIYERAFDLAWIKENTPPIAGRRLILALSFVTVFALMIAGYFAWQDYSRSPAERAAGYVADFQAANTPQEQMASLAGLFELGGDFAGQARGLFFRLPSDQSKKLFVSDLSPKERADQIVIIKGVYQHLNNVPEDNELLEAMGNIVGASDIKLQDEIRYWVTGRVKLNDADYYAAEASLTMAINQNKQNPMLYFERAQAYIGEGPSKYHLALKDFSQLVQLDSSRKRDVRVLINSNPSLSSYINNHQDSYEYFTYAVSVHVRRSIYDARDSTSLPGVIVRREGDPPTGDVDVDLTYDALGYTYEFFWDIYGRDSVDDQGEELVATVHYPTKFDENWWYAFQYWNGSSGWTGQQLVFGDCCMDLPEDQRLFERFITIDSVASCVVTGIIEHEANFGNLNQPGALKMSFMDIFASLVKQYQRHQTAVDADWIIGEGVFSSIINGVGFRSLEAPGTAYNDPVIGVDPQPSHMNNYISTASDNGGIHINSGIPNHAFYITAIELGGFAWEKAGRIWYIALRDKLQPKSDFQDAANMTYQVAGELYGPGSPEQAAVQTGWAEVGIQVNVP